MSYLNVPRLHFAGTFNADPSTINNSPSNYDNTGSTPPSSITPSWNPYGSHAWSIDSTVQSFVDPDGQLQETGDPLIGATVKSVAGPSGVSAKLVDLDVFQQGRTQLFGLFIEIALPGSSRPALSGYFQDGARLTNLWFARAQGPGLSTAGGAFQSVLTDLQWGDTSGSPFLEALRSASPEELSVRLTPYGYDSVNTSPTFTRGHIVGTLGPSRSGEPRHFVAQRFLNPAQGSAMWFAPAQVDPQIKALVIDLGNSVPEQSPGGLPVDLGVMQAAILCDDHSVILGNIDYSAPQYRRTAGVVQFGLIDEHLALIAHNPIGILTTATGRLVRQSQYLSNTSIVSLAESPDGVYVEVDLFTCRLSSGECAAVPLYARKFGRPLADFQADIEPVRSQGANLPADGLQFPSSVTTGAEGKAEITLAGGSFTASQLPPSRRDTAGQVYFLGGSWASAADATSTAPITALVFEDVAEVPNPTWKDVQPLLYQYYVLYGYMAAIVNLSNYGQIKANAQRVKGVLTRPISDAGYMPVSRDLSPAKKKIILDWIDQGCPA